jgi:hypothetical protein
MEDPWRLIQKLEKKAYHVHADRRTCAPLRKMTELRSSASRSGRSDGGSWRPLTLDLRPDSSLRKESCPPLTLLAFVAFKMDFNFFLLLPVRPYSCLPF